MKKYVKRIISVVLLIAIAVGGLWYADLVLVPKRLDGIVSMQDFYAQPEGTVDVLLVGNSHSGVNIDTATLWSEYGLSAMTFGAASNRCGTRITLLSRR